MNRIVTVGLPAAALIALGAATSSLLGIGVAGAAPAATSKPATITMYANVDQYGDLGSHVGAVSASGTSSGYIVTFNRTITNCAAEVTPGYAGGTLQAKLWAAKVVYSGTKAFSVLLGTDTVSGLQSGASAFMITVTCKN